MGANSQPKTTSEKKTTKLSQMQFFNGRVWFSSSSSIIFLCFRFFFHYYRWWYSRSVCFNYKWNFCHLYVCILAYLTASMSHTHMHTYIELQHRNATIFGEERAVNDRITWPYKLLAKGCQVLGVAFNCLPDCLPAMLKCICCLLLFCLLSIWWW